MIFPTQGLKLRATREAYIYVYVYVYIYIHTYRFCIFFIEAKQKGYIDMCCIDIPQIKGYSEICKNWGA